MKRKASDRDGEVANANTVKRNEPIFMNQEKGNEAIRKRAKP